MKTDLDSSNFTSQGVRKEEINPKLAEGGKSERLE
jgi:hypothetical protein